MTNLAVTDQRIVQRILEKAKWGVAIFKLKALPCGGAKKEMVDLILDRIKTDKEWFDFSVIKTRWKYRSKHRKQKIFRDACLDLSQRGAIETRVVRRSSSKGTLQARKLIEAPSSIVFDWRIEEEKEEEFLEDLIDEDFFDDPAPFFRCVYCFRLVQSDCNRSECENWKAKF